MKNLKFSVGDRVALIEQTSDALPLPLLSEGTIMWVRESRSDVYDYAVEWDDSFDRGYVIRRENGLGVKTDLTTISHGWMVNENCLELINSNDNVASISRNEIDAFMMMPGGPCNEQGIPAFEGEAIL